MKLDTTKRLLEHFSNKILETATTAVKERELERDYWKSKAISLAQKNAPKQRITKDDETNFWIDGVEFQKNRLYHKGVWMRNLSEKRVRRNKK